MLAEFVEIESGRKSDRPALDQALATARIHCAPIIVAKVDRLTRSVGFLSRLLEAGVDVRFADLPAVEGPTGRFMLQQMAAVAELEAGLISTRTKLALVAAKVRGKKLGGNRGVQISDVARAAGRASRSKRSSQRAIDLAPLFADLAREGIVSASGLAGAFNERKIPTARGCARWTATQIGRVLKKINSNQ